MNSVLEFTFEDRREAEQALEEANAKWQADELRDRRWKPHGEVMRINLNDGMQEPDENGAFWMITSEDGEWMVSRITCEWHCVA